MHDLEKSFFIHRYTRSRSPVFNDVERKKKGILFTISRTFSRLADKILKGFGRTPPAEFTIGVLRRRPFEIPTDISKAG